MTAEKKAHNDRAKMETVLFTAQLEVVQCCSQASPGVRQVEKKLSSLQAAWNLLMDAHVSYCSAIGLTIGSGDSQTYIKEQQLIYMTGKTQAEKILDKEEETEPPDKAQMGTDFKREIKLMELDIEELVKCLNKVVSAPVVSMEGLKEANEIMKKLDNKLRVEYKVLTGRIGENMETADAKAEKERTGKFMMENIPMLGDLTAKLMVKVPVKEEKPGGVPVRDSGGGGNREEIKKNRVKTAPMPVPKWDGRSRTYPRFKKMWEENIIPYNESSALHMMLVQALPELILEEISSLASSYEVIWDHLENKAGRAEVVARDIVGELMRVDHKKLGKRFFPKYSALLEDSEALLTTMGMQDWISSSRSVSDLENLLPYSEKLEWAKVVKGASGVERFTKFKTFLRERKEILEAMETIGGGVKTPESDVCTFCKRDGHLESDCRTKKRNMGERDLPRGQGNTGGGGAKGAGGGGANARGFIPDFRNGCAICGEKDHWKNECPNRNTSKDRNVSGGRGGRGPPQAGGGQGGRGGAGQDGSVNSNQLRTADCNRCKYAPNNITNCIGCKMSGNVDHCLLHCGQFLCLGVDDRVKLVKSANGCAVCLSGSHLAATCNYKDKSGWVCGISGCRSHHHPSLHGSRDAFVKINVLVVDQGGDRFKEVTDWEARTDYFCDSYMAKEDDNVSAERQLELQQAREELVKPGLGGDQVLLVVMEVGMVYGPERMLTTVVAFFLRWFYLFSHT